jgi:hypothetical protein
MSPSKPQFSHLPLSTSGPIDCAVTGTALLNTPYLNKGSAFPPDERRKFNLTGLLPAREQTLEQQVTRAYQQYSTRPDDLAKNTFLTSLKNQNEVLYYKVCIVAVSTRAAQIRSCRLLRTSYSNATSRRCSASCIHQPKAMPYRTIRGSLDAQRAAT